MAERAKSVRTRRIDGMLNHIVNQTFGSDAFSSGRFGSLHLPR